MASFARPRQIGVRVPGQDRVGPAAPRTDKRRAPRKRVLVPALIGVPGYRLQVPCRIIDMSTTGAGTMIVVDPKNRVRSALDLPDRIVLMITPDRIEVDCQICWRDGERFGAKFISSTRPLRPITR